MVSTLLALDGATGGNVSGGLAKLGGDIGSGIAGWFGTTALDRERKAWVQGFANRAATGDAAAVRQLEFAAFEKRQGLPGDSRTPVDGKSSPPTTRNAAASVLAKLAAQGVPLSKPEYYAKLAVPQPATFVQTVLSPVAGGIAEAFRPVVAQEAQGAAAATLRAVVPWVVGALVLSLSAYLLLKLSR